MQAVQALRADLDAANRLRSFFAARQVDRDFLQQKDARLIYAVDSSVLYSQFAPAGEAVDDAAFRIFKGPPGARDLQTSLQTCQHRIGSVIVSYLIEQVALTPQGTPLLLLLPGHDAETSSLYDKIASEFWKQPELYTRATTLAKELDAYREARSHAPRASSDRTIRQLTDQLYAVLYLIEDPHQKFYRFNDLLKRGVLLKSSVAGAHQTFQEPRYRSRGRAILAAPEGAPNEAARLWWMSQLQGWVSPPYIHNDSLALHELDRLNWALRPSRARVVLFTMNDRLIEATRKYKPLGDHIGDPQADLTFGDLYLRHPLCLLDEPHFSRPAEAKVAEAAETSNDDWIDALLEFRLEDDLEPPQRATAPQRARDYSDAELVEALAIRPDFHHAFVKKWTAYLRNLAAEHSSVSDLARRNIDELLRRVEQPDEHLTLSKGVEERVSKLTVDSWSDFFKTVARTGLELVQVATTSDHPVVYAAPLLVMLGGDRRREALQALWDVAAVRTDPEPLVKKISALGDDRHPKRRPLQDSYAQTLAYGILFAYMGRWKITRLLAQRAIATAEVIQQSPREVDPANPEEWIDGREAHYLHAMALRVTARTQSDLGPALEAIKMAKILAARDPRDRPKPELTGIRFFAEEVAIRSAILAAPPLTKPDTKEAAVRGEELERLRGQIVDAIKGAPKCSEPLVCAHASAMMRSEYFYLTGMQFEAARDVAKRRSVILAARGLAPMIEAQMTDLKILYRQARWLPFRARGLLRLACALSEEEGLVEPEWREPYTATLKRFPDAVGDVLRPVEHKRLSRIEVLIENVERFRDLL